MYLWSPSRDVDTIQIVTVMASVTEMMEVIGESAGVRIILSWTGIRLILNVWAVSCFE